MSVSYGATGTVLNTASGSPSVAYPSGITAGQMLILACYTYEAGGTVLSPSGGWTFVGQSPLGSSVQVHVFAKIATGSESGSVAINPDATIDIVGHISRFEKSLGAWDDVYVATGSESNSAPEWLMTTTEGIPRETGDMLVAFAQGNGGSFVRDWSDETIAGAAATEIVNAHRSGISMQGHTSYAIATSTSSSTVVHSAELNTNMAGSGLVLRLRDLSTHTDFRGWGYIPIKADS